MNKGFILVVLATIGALSASVFSAEQTKCLGDFDGDGIVYSDDLAIISSAWHTHAGDKLYDIRADPIHDGYVDADDLTQISASWKCGMN